MDEQIIKTLIWRYSVNLFDAEKKILEEDLNTILEAGRLSPSSYGLQPWKFLVVKNKETREKLRQASWNQPQITEASHLVVLCRPEILGLDLVERQVNITSKTRGQPLETLEGYKKMLAGFVSRLSKEKAEAWMEKQVYIALGFMLETAALMGIDSCPMEGFDSGKYDEILGLPEQGWKSVVVLTLGYRSQADESATRAKVRFEKEEVVGIIGEE